MARFGRDASGRAPAFPAGEDQLRLLIEQAPVSLAMFDRQLRYLACSGRWRREFPAGDDSQPGRHYDDVWPDAPPAWREAHQRGLAGESVVHAASSWTDAAGQSHLTRYEVQPWRQKDGELGGIIVLTEDVAASQDATCALGDVAACYRLLAAVYPDAMFVSVGGHFVYANPAAAKLLGVQDPEELIGLPVLTVVAPEDRERLRGRMSAILDRQEIVPLVEQTWLRRDGMRVTVEVAVGPITWYGEAGVQLVVRDVTLRKETEAALRESESRYKFLTELTRYYQSNDPRAMVDALCRKVMQQLECDLYLNYLVDRPSGRLQLFAYSGISDEVARRLEWLEIEQAVCGTVAHTARRIVAEDIQRCADPLTSLVQSLGMQVYACHPLMAGSDVLGTLSFGSSVRPKFLPVELDLMQTVAEHVSAAMLRIRDQQQLHDREELLKAVLNTAADAIVTIDRTGTIVSINQATEQMFGYTREELLGQNVRRLMPPPYCDEHDDYLARYLETGEARIIGRRREVVAQRRDGSTFPIELAVSEIKQLQMFTAVARDISERKELQQRVLQIAAEEQRRIGYELHDGIQQELTGLSLFAGSLCDALEKYFPPVAPPPTQVDSPLDDPHPGDVRCPPSQAAVPPQGTFVEAEDLVRLRQTAERLSRGLIETHQHVQELAHGILPVQIEADGLASALDQLAVQTDAQHDIACEFIGSEEIAVTNDTMATHLYRIAQEALNNAVRHGQADSIRIALYRTKGSLVLEIRDNGDGFDPAHQHTAARGMGLRTMEHRASLIGGMLQIESQPAGGSVVRCTVPPARLPVSE